MKHSLNTFLTLLFVCASAWGENVPWQNPQINESECPGTRHG